MSFSRFQLKRDNSSVTDGRMDKQMDKASYRVVCPQLKILLKSQATYIDTRCQITVFSKRVSQNRHTGLIGTAGANRDTYVNCDIFTLVNFFLYLSSFYH